MNKIKLSDFIVLDIEEKKLVTLHEGVLIAKRKNQEYIIFLFQLETFYTEMYCSLETKAILEFRVFDGTAPLTPYLESIPINDLL